MGSRRFDALPLSALRAFDAVVRTGSAKAAAQRLGVTPAAVSHQLRALEEHLGTALFDRFHRELRMTRAGAELAAATSPAFDTIAGALDSMAANGITGGRQTLTVSAAPTFATKWLAPRLHTFQAAHPEIELRLRADEILTDPSRDRRIDVAIRYGAGPIAADLDAVRLWTEGRIVPVAAPAIAAELADPVDLLNYVLLRTAAPALPPGAPPIDWTAWFAACGIDDPRLASAVARGPLLGATQLALEAAVAGRGIALSPDVLIQVDLESGRLVIPFPVALPDSFAYWLVTRKDRGGEARIRAFAKWLRDAAASVVLS